MLLPRGTLSPNPSRSSALGVQEIQETTALMINSPFFLAQLGFLSTQFPQRARVYMAARLMVTSVTARILLWVAGSGLNESAFLEAVLWGSSLLLVNKYMEGGGGSGR